MWIKHDKPGTPQMHWKCSINGSLLEKRVACEVPGRLWQIFHRSTVLKSHDFPIQALEHGTQLRNSALEFLDVLEWERWVCSITCRTVERGQEQFPCPIG